MPVTTQRNPTYINVKDFPGVVGDGVHDDTAGIQAAINAAAGGVIDGTNTQGGIVFFPWTPGNTYLHHGLVLYSHILLLGSWKTTLMLASLSNTDSIQGYNAPSLIGSTNAGGIVNWGIADLIIDGNKGAQTSASYGVRQYGYGFILQNVIIRNTYSDIIRSDWNGGSASNYDSMEAKIIDCKFHDSGAIGLNWTGPHDSTISGVEVYKTGSHAFYIGPNATGMKFMSCHGYNMATGVNAATWLIEGTGFQAVNCVAEGSDVCDVVILASKASWVGGSIFCFNTGTPINNVGGVQIGQQAGQTPWPNSVNQSAGVTTAVAPFAYMVDSLYSKCEGPNGTIWFANDGGNGFVRGPVSLELNANANKTFTGVLGAGTRVSLFPNGVTADGTAGKGGWERLSISANKAYTIVDAATGFDILNVSTSGKKVECPNGVRIVTYSDNYATPGSQLVNGTLALGQSTSAAALASGGTITTNNVGLARVAPPAAVSGVVLQSGTIPGQMVMVSNESANSITLSSANLAAGAQTTIAANTKQIYVWDSIVGVWF